LTFENGFLGMKAEMDRTPSMLSKENRMDYLEINPHTDDKHIILIFGGRTLYDMINNFATSDEFCSKMNEAVRIAVRNRGFKLEKLIPDLRLSELTEREVGVENRSFIQFYKDEEGNIVLSGLFSVEK